MFKQHPLDREASKSSVDSSVIAQEGQDARQLLRELCQRQAPLWSLERFIALNPLQGWTGQSFLETAAAHKRDLNADLYPEWSFFREAFEAGKITADDLVRALREQPLPSQYEISLDSLIRELPSASARAAQLLPLPSESSQFAAPVRELLNESLAQSCAAYFDQAQTPWGAKNPAQFLSLWLATTVHDRSWDFAGLGFVRRHLKKVQQGDAWNCLQEMLDSWAPEREAKQAILRRLAQGIQGWVAYGCYQDRVWNFGHAVAAEQILLARTLIEWAVWSELPEKKRPGSWNPSLDPALQRELFVRDIWLRAHEAAARRELLSTLSRRSQLPSETAIRYQFVFCIDARSEPIRRQLEAQSPAIETIGFAGFFGIPLAARNEAGDLTERCPFLLPASVYLDSQVTSRSQSKFLPELLSRNLNTCFSYVETLGLFQAPRLLARSFRRRSARSQRPQTSILLRKDHSPVSVQERAAMARGFLKHSGLKNRLANYVFLCGHGSSTENNPYASSLACGACGGHQGDINAVIACQVLNDPLVRQELDGTEWSIPPETVFVPMLHETCGQRLQFLDESALPDTECQQLTRFLQAAERGATAERAAREGRRGEPELDAQRRAGDWSEVRPEWGLANNLYFIAAPRALTAGLDLKARAFLHNYDPDHDRDEQTLELILTAPLVVAYGINMQYFTSRVDPQQLGSGSKVLHNLVGSFGVLEGTSYQLRSGLPWQSLHDGTSFQHEPLRLQVLIRSTAAAIDRVLQKHRAVEQLIEGGWISLVVWDDEGKARQRMKAGLWKDLAHD